MTTLIPRYPTGTLVRLFPDGVVTGTVENVVANEPPQYWVKWDDGNYSCHAQRDLKRVQNWIKCSERMPECYKAILVHNKFGEMWVACLSSRGEYWCDDLKVEYVTHWQPLPEPPND